MVRASASAVCGASAARRTKRSGIGRLLRRFRTGAVEGKPEVLLAGAVGGNRRVHFLDVVAALGDRLAAALDAGADLLDLGAGILERIDPIPFRRQPLDR